MKWCKCGKPAKYGVIDQVTGEILWCCCIGHGMVLWHARKEAPDLA